MMPDPSFDVFELARVTCIVHQKLAPDVAKELETVGLRAVIEQRGRCVRQLVRSRRWWFAGDRTELHDSPMKIFRFVAAEAEAWPIMANIARAAELNLPGRGTVFSQKVLEYRFRGRVVNELPPPADSPPGNVGSAEFPGFFEDLTLITAILSSQGRGDVLAKTIIGLGAGVPIISRGISLGTRDRMNLLRITIAPEKEIIQVIVPAHDAHSIMRLIIEGGEINKPGGGFMYQTPIQGGFIDSMMRIGRQEHPASIDQIIAAIDDLKGGTAWRKRFLGLDDVHGRNLGCQDKPYQEIAFVCSEGKSDSIVQAAVRAGAGATTMSQVSRVSLDTSEEGIAARERGILCVPASAGGQVVAAVVDAAATCDPAVCRIHTIPSPAVFSHHRQRA